MPCRGRRGSSQEQTWFMKFLACKYEDAKFVERFWSWTFIYLWKWNVSWICTLQFMPFDDHLGEENEFYFLLTMHLISFVVFFQLCTFEILPIANMNSVARTGQVETVAASCHIYPEVHAPNGNDVISRSDHHVEKPVCISLSSNPWQDVECDIQSALTCQHLMTRFLRDPVQILHTVVCAYQEPWYMNPVSWFALQTFLW